MALKLIRREDPSSSRIQALLFSESGCCQISEVAAPQKRSATAAPLVPDPAEIEKAAYESGFRQGEKAGLQMAEKKAEALMRRYADAIFAVERLKSQLFARAERDVVKLALEVARKIVHREIARDSEIIETLVKVALGHVAVKSAVTIRLHPVDYGWLLEHRSGITRGPDDDKEVILVADPAVERGGCLIQTECGDVDARIEEEFREVEHSFFDIGEQ